MGRNGRALVWAWASYFIILNKGRCFKSIIKKRREDWKDDSLNTG
jgi:hypothetical protein